MSMFAKKGDITQEDRGRLMGVFSLLPRHLLWSRVKGDDFTVRRFAGGFMNDISCCSLTPEARERLATTPDDILSIVVKFAPKEMLIQLSRLEFVANNTTLSSLGLAPALLYVDEKCIINEFIQSRNSAYEDDTEPETIYQTARLLAGIHSAKPAISGSGFTAWRQTFLQDPSGHLPPLYQAIQGKEYLKLLEKESPEAKEKYYSFFNQINLKETLEYMRTLIESVQSPFVFSHCDFNRGNRIVQETVNGDGTKAKKLYIIDIDFSHFNYRGIDIGRYFANYQQKEEVFGDEGFFPDDQEMSIFLSEYRRECSRLQGRSYLERVENSLEQLLREAKVFVLFTYIEFVFPLMMYTGDPMGPKKDVYLKAAFDRYSTYKEQKERFIADGTTPFVLAHGKAASPVTLIKQS